MIKNFRKSLILTLSLIISIIVYEINYTKPLYSVKMVLLKDNSYISNKINLNIDALKIKDDINTLAIIKNKIELISSSLDYQKKTFEGLIFHEKYGDERLKQIYDICKKFQISYEYYSYHNVTCLTEQPKFAAKLIDKNINLIWGSINMKKAYINFDTNHDFLFTKTNELKVSKTYNNIKNIFKYCGVIIFFFLIFVLRKKII